MATITIAEKGELRWVSRARDAKQQVCFDVTCDYPGIEVWLAGDEWRCQVRASEHEAMAIAYGGDTAEHAVRLGLEKLESKKIAPDALLKFARSQMERMLRAPK